jgi:O-antigen ligase
MPAESWSLPSSDEVKARSAILIRLGTFHSATLSRAAAYLAIGSAASVIVSNAVSQMVLAAALLTLLAARERPRLPPIRLPLILFFLGTVIALLLSPDPQAGLPQLKKFYVYLVLVVMYTALRGVEDVRRIVLLWAGLAAASGVWSFEQFFRKRGEAIASGEDFYLYYVANRATGFMSHWMTFSAEQMIAGLMLTAVLMFGAFRWRRTWAFAALGVIGGSLMIAWTRSVWLAAIIGFVYLISVWRPKMLLLTPVAGAALWFIAPHSAQERILSIYEPRSQDSNEHRLVTFRTGLEMIRAHPWFGIGPDMVKRDFEKYVPADISRPLPEGYYGHLHNVYLQYAADRGIPTLLALLWLIGKAMRDFIRAVRGLGPEERLRRAILHGALAVTIAVLTEAFFEYNLGDSEVLNMFLVVLAAGYIAADREAARA